MAAATTATLEVLDQVTDGGIVERRAVLRAGGSEVPAIHWLPSGPEGVRPTVCIGHGGFQHKRSDNVLALARQLVAQLEVGVVALDAPEHGDRESDPGASARTMAALAQGDRGARARAFGPEARAAMARRAAAHVSEWRSLLDALQQDPRWAAGPFGWWGVSMGTTHGLPLTAGDDRIAAAVFGLNALRPGDERWAAQAASVTVPVLFLCQWDDELMTRESALALWDTLGSRDKSLHVNPGRHVEVPRVERQASVDFFRRHLL